MNIADFTEPQRSALLDLLVMAMYVDGNLASAEEACIQQLITAMGMKTEYDRGQVFDAAVTRVRQHAGKPESACAHAGVLAQNFSKPDQRQRVTAMLRELMESDGAISPGEGKFLAAVEEAFRA